MNILWAELIIEELVRCGVDYFCISPGSRSTPLVVAAARNKRARTIVCYDERGAGYHAVGYARATGKPAAVITTSGTAVANLLPAIVEASNDNLPLIALTADRPAELIDCGANQAIKQPGIFGNYTRFEFDIPTPTLEIGPEFVLTTIDQAVYRASDGPVHINCRYREPLLADEAEIDEEYTADIAGWASSGQAFTSYAAPCVLPSEEDAKSLAEIIDTTDKGLIVIGKLTSEDDRNACMRLIQKLGWPVYADVTSGLRLTHCGTNIIRYFDQELLSDEFNFATYASTVLHIGGCVTSKRMGQFLDDNRPENYIVIKNNSQRADHIHAVTMHLEAEIASSLDIVCDMVTQRDSDEFSAFYDEKASQADAIIKKHVEADESVTEPFIARSVTEMVADGSRLFLSSSMPIRDVDLYGASERKDVTVAANRGVSGIDGVIASATGFAVGTNRATTLVIGDMAFMHDVNSLTQLGRIDVPVVIVLINNGGGGIFHFLPISEASDVFEEYFVAPHEYKFAGVCKTFGVDHFKPASKAEFIRAYNTAVSEGKPAVIEVATNREANLKMRREIKKEIIEMLQE